jgi:hypothetical protein
MAIIAKACELSEGAIVDESLSMKKNYDIRSTVPMTTPASAKSGSSDGITKHFGLKVA